MKTDVMLKFISRYLKFLLNRVLIEIILKILNAIFDLIRINLNDLKYISCLESFRTQSLGYEFILIIVF
jgi:hypothetical protein